MKRYYVSGPGDLTSVFSVVNDTIIQAEGTHTQDWFGKSWQRMVNSKNHNEILIEEAAVFNGDGTYDVVWTYDHRRSYTGVVTIKEGKIIAVGGNLIASWTKRTLADLEFFLVRDTRSFSVSKTKESSMFEGDGDYDIAWTQVGGPNHDKRHAGTCTIRDSRISNVSGSLVSSWNGVPFQSLENYLKHDCRNVVVTKRKSEPKLYVEIAAAVQQARKDEREKFIHSLEQRASFIRAAVNRLGSRNISDPGSDYEEYVKQSAVLRYLDSWIRELKGSA